MRSPRFIAAAMLAVGMVVGPTASFAEDPPQPAPDAPVAAPEGPPAPAPANRAAADPAADPLTAIRNAPDPSAAVEAYARANKAAGGDTAALEQAYVSRLVALGLPELAESQARDLIQRKPDDGVAWAVVAYMDARRGDTAGGISAIVSAARLAPDDPFVQRTAGQLAAYYDRNADRVTLPAAVKSSFDDVRKAMAGKDAYARAYKESSDAYAEGPSTEPVPYAAPYGYGAPSAPSSSYYDSYYNRAYYPAPYYSDPYFYGYGYPYYPWWPSWWWGGASFVFFNDHHHHDHDHHDGHFHDGHFHDGHFHGNDFHGNNFHGNNFHGNNFHGNQFNGTRVGFRGSVGHAPGFNSGTMRTVPLRASAPLGSRGLAGRSSFAPSSFGSRSAFAPSGFRGGTSFRGSPGFRGGTTGAGMRGGGIGGGMRGGMGGGMHGGGGGGGHR
jgi:hypothetical protein